MGRKSSKTPASNQVSTRKAPQTNPLNMSSSSSSSPSQPLAQPVQQTAPSRNIIGSPPARDWTSALGLDQSDIHRASISPFSAPKRVTKLSQQNLQRKHAHNSTPTSIMTSFNGVPIYSQGTSAYPAVTSAPRAPGLQNVPNNNSRPANDKIVLPRPDQTVRYNPSAYRPSPFTKSIAPPPPPPSTQQPFENTPPHDPPPFDPGKCHWRALRDVAFVLDSGMDLASEDLCALLRFRYAMTDPQMAGVEPGRVQVMYEFCREGGKEMYESEAGKWIRVEMEAHLK
ncbi:MAG: hypothetical protein ASARMPRED_004728, partial [Alectoria sarmentosa]